MIFDNLVVEVVGIFRRRREGCRTQVVLIVGVMSAARLELGSWIDFVIECYVRWQACLFR